MNHVAVEYVPQIGYLVVVDQADEHFVDPQCYQYVYQNESKLYFKHPYVLAMDDDIGDIRSTIMDRQKALVTILCSAIHPYIL